MTMHSISESKMITGQWTPKLQPCWQINTSLMTCYRCNKLHRNHKNNNIIQLTQRNIYASMQ